MHRTFRLGAAAATLACLAPAQVNWTSLAATNAPRALCAHTWDPVRNRLIAFGGQATTFANTTWEWNGTQWLTATPTSSPTARARAAMVFDRARGNIVLFGGNTGGATGFSSQTWTYDGTTWTQRTPATVPLGRYGAAMAYDQGRDVVVMFGGFVQSGSDNAEVWEWNGSNWTQRTWSGFAPQARGAHRMVFDEALGETLLFGGYRTPAQTTLADCWSWNGTAWTQRAAGPGSLCDQAFAYDPTRQRAILQGGLNIVGSTVTTLSATWEWDGAGWTQRSTAVTPSARSSSANDFDPINRRLIVGGGITGFGVQPTDTLAYAPITPGTVTEVGFACPSSAGPLGLTTTTLPYYGSPFVQEVSNGPLTMPFALMIFGSSHTQWNGIPLPADLTVIGAPGCFLDVSFDVVLTMTLSNGEGTITWVLPNQPSITGFEFSTQALVFDPLSPNPFQIAMSSGRHCVVGAP